MNIINYKTMKYRIINKVGKLLGKKQLDDFDWKLYNIHYEGELDSISKNHTIMLKQGDYIFTDQNLIKQNGQILPLHPNHRLMYETILQLRPSSAMEFGCGGGDHLHNLSLLIPGIKLYGLDISENQIKFLKKRHPSLQAAISRFDITLPLPVNTQEVDIAYTQAVIMHIQTGNAHKVALRNLFHAATRQVVLMENWKRHNFMEDINELFNKNIIPWKQIFYYYRDSEELKKPHIMLVSAVPLPQYKILEDYRVLAENV